MKIVHRLLITTASLFAYLWTFCVVAPSAFATADVDLWKRQIIYLVLVDRFYNGDPTNDTLGASGCYDPGRPDKFHGGDLAGLRKKREYLAELGITVIWITPLYQQVPNVRSLGQARYGECGYHGYWPDFTDPPTTAIEPKLGTQSDFSQLLADLHAHNIKLILDMVVNHAGYGAKIVDQHPDWFHQRDNCEDLGDRQTFCPIYDLPDFKQELESGAVADYLIQQSAMWVRRFPIDGIRMDTASHVPPWFFRDRWIPKINGARKGLFLLAEASPERSLEQLKPFVEEQRFDSVFNFPLREAFVETFAEGHSVDAVADAVQHTLVTMGIDQATMLVNLLDNHDVPRFLGQPDHGTDIESLRRHYHLALTALFTLPGIPQLYYGDELGLFGAGDPSNRADMPSWAWTRSGRLQTNLDIALSPPEPTFSHTQRLIALRKANSALFRGNYAELSRQGSSAAPNLFAFLRMDGGNRIITVLNNSDNSLGIVTLPIWSNGALTRADREALADGTVLDDLLEADRGSAVALTDGQLALNISPKTGVIYRPRSHDSASEVKFTVRTTAAFNEAMYVSGDIQELGSWDPRRAIRMTPSECGGTRCTWSVRLRYLRHGSSVKFKFLRKSDTATVWEGGCDRLYEVPATASSSYSGVEWRSGGCP